MNASSVQTSSEVRLLRHDEREHRRAANRAVAVSALGLALTGGIELALAFFTGSVALLGDGYTTSRMFLPRQSSSLNSPFPSGNTPLRMLMDTSEQRIWQGWE
jgi:hypothetical protein